MGGLTHTPLGWLSVFQLCQSCPELKLVIYLFLCDKHGSVTNGFRGKIFNRKQIWWLFGVDSLFP